MLNLSVSVLWVLAGCVFIAIEAFGIPGIGFIFAGIAAVIVGVIVETDVVSDTSYVAQTAYWFGLTVAAAVILWKPLKKFRVNKDSDDSFNNMIGTKATVCDGALEKGKQGKARWSGATMNAELDKDADVSSLSEGTVAEICAVRGTTIILKPRS